MFGYKNNLGITLIELLVCLAIVAILIGISIPSFLELTQKHHADKVMNDLARSISLARFTAVNSNSMVTFCKSNDGQSCGGKWEQGAIVFVDQNADRKINDNDRIIHVMPGSSLGGSLKFRAFQNKQYLQMTPLGFTNYQNGNFTFCPENNDALFAQQLIINRTARTRFAMDSDGDGYRENSKGEPLSCP